MKILQIVDSSIIYYTFYHSSKTVDFSNNSDLHKALIEFINEGGLYPFANNGATIKSLWLIDSKPYWKNLYEPEYKAHRRRPLISNENQVYLQNVHTFANYLEFEYFEADDIAGAVSRCDLSEFDRVFYLTGDSDWLGLLDKAGVRYCINPCSSTIKARNSWSAYQWYTSEYGQESAIKKEKSMYKLKRWGEFEPSEIFLYKTAFGDTSDNLPVGSCRGLIDLLHPVSDYDLLNYVRYKTQIEQTIKNAKYKEITGMNTFLQYFRTWGDTPIQSCTVNDFEYATKMLSTAKSAMI